MAKIHLKNQIAILGNGAWGMAMAGLSQRRGNFTAIWGRSWEGRKGMAGGARPAETLKDALEGAEIVLFAIPSHAIREVSQQAKDFLSSKALLISLAKGIEQESDLCASEVIAQVTGRKEIAVMSGPTFAAEVDRRVPTAIVCASKREKWAEIAQDAFHGEDFRVYTSTDVRGVELGGALKNVMAIAAGACSGLELGENTMAALITRGLAELARVGTLLGGKTQTFFGLSGVGDLILTCSSPQSRNHQVGDGLGRGLSLEVILNTLEGTAEGIRTAKSVHQILEKDPSLQKRAPILEEVYRVLYEGKTASRAVSDLMGREAKKEN